jgi:hypothetical protein
MSQPARERPDYTIKAQGAPGNHNTLQPHRYPIGYRLGHLVVTAHLPRVLIGKTTPKTAPNYRLRCRCGSSVERNQNVLRHAESLGREAMCDDCLKESKGIKTAWEVPRPTSWGYDPREAI